MSIPKNLHSVDRSVFQRLAIMVVLIGAGEGIFILPFVIVRIFRPTLLEVFGLNNFQLGTAFSLYGIVAMFSYFLGGPLADRYSTRSLMSLALLLTALGGVVYSYAPSFEMLIIIYGFWGLTTVLLFWSPLIKATRQWGGSTTQGRAYGILDGGRGLLSAVISSISVVIFASFVPDDVTSATIDEKSFALSRVIWFYNILVILTAILVWYIVRDPVNDTEAVKSPIISSKVKELLGRPLIWLQALIVLCAYVGYKGTDDFSLYAYDAFGYDEVEAATIATISFWIRPFAALGAGLLADYTKPSISIIISFGLLLLGSAVIAMGYLEPGMDVMIILTIAATSAGIYALRGVYFALFQEAKIPLAYTGMAVGIVSFVGYTPDIFMGPLMGYLLDSNPGTLGHQHVFALLGGFSALGLITVLVFRTLIQNRKQKIL